MENNNQTTETGQPPVDGQAETTQPTDSGAKLPSEMEDVVTDAQWLENNVDENGKILGRFGSLNEAFEYYRKQEVSHTNNMREIKEAQKANEQEDQSAIEQAQRDVERQKGLAEIVPEFVNNGMNITDELKAKASELGLSDAEIELGAYKLRESISTAHNTVGGEEEYQAMMAWAGENLSDNLKKQFDTDISDLLKGNSGVGVLAIEGLHARYKAGVADTSNDQYRITGDSTPTPVTGYKDQQEMIRDLRAANKSGDPALMKRYQEKLSKTSDSVIFGR